MHRVLSVLPLIPVLVGCGADVASTTTTQAVLEAQAAAQAQETKRRVQSELDAAMQTAQQRLQQADEAAR